MKRKIIAFIGAFILSINLLGQSSLTVYASDDLSGFNEWETSEKASYLFSHFVSTVSSALSFVISRGYNSQDILWSYLQACYDDLQVENCDYEEWLAYRLNVQQNTTTGEYELVLDDELVDLMKQACDKYIKEQTGWYEIQTADVSDVSATWFSTQADYNKFVGFLKNLGPNDGIVVKSFTSYLPSGSDEWVTGATCSDIFDVTEFDLVLDRYEEVSASYPYGGISFKFYKDWADDSTVMSNLRFMSSATELIDNPTNDTSWADGWYSVTMDACTFPSIDVRNSQTATQFVGGDSPWRRVLFTKTSKLLRVYKTVDDMKMYSVGERPYYATSDFYNYDSSQDNSVTLTGSDLSNGSVYGDVYNYIINNYDNPDGLTEDELRDILDDYFNNSGGGSGSSGNGSGSGSSGNGLMDFLGGLGSIGDAILSILGKLMEYIGKALDLIGGTVTKVIDIIPKNITALLGALFPFFPEEWLTAIELGLVLAVIVGIVGLFKK